MMLTKYEDLEYTSNSDRSTLFPILASAVCTGIIGALVSFVTNCTLAEISTNAFFSLYFGLFFIFIGLIVLHRGCFSESNKVQLLLFGLAIVLSGVICFMVEKNWFIGISAHTKIGLYSLIGASITFSLAFTVVDLANYLATLCHKRAFIDQAEQIHLILYSSIILGVVFGFVFGLMDIEDAAEYELRLKVMSEERYCFPLGFFVGGICGFLNERIRQKDFEYCNELDYDL